MGFGAGETLEARWASVRSVRTRLIQRCDSILGVSIISREIVLKHAREYQAYKEELIARCANADTDGLEGYAREQQNNATLDISAELAIVVSAVEALQAWLLANFPNAGGELCVYEWDADMRPQPIDLTNPQVNAYQIRVQTLRDAL